MIEPGVYVGTLQHRRMLQTTHAFTYPLFMVLLDIDRLQELMSVSHLTSYGRWNWAAFDERDHLGDPTRPLRERLAADAAQNGLTLPDGPVFLLTHLRYLGYCFNPISLFYCCDSAGDVRLVLADVRNTFGGRHSYWLSPDGLPGRFQSTAEKSLYVSPFMPIDLRYDFTLSAPQRHLLAHIRARRDESVHFDATLSLERRPWTANEIRGALIRFPVMTVSVILGIHWQALKLWWKGVPPVSRATPHGAGERAAWAQDRVEGNEAQAK